MTHSRLREPVPRFSQIITPADQTTVTIAKAHVAWVLTIGAQSVQFILKEVT